MTAFEILLGLAFKPLPFLLSFGLCLYILSLIRFR